MAKIDAQKIAILGSGAWGTTLGKVLTEAGHSVTIWGVEEDVVHQIMSEHVQPSRLPGVDLPEELKATTEVDDAIDGAEFIIVAIAAQFARGALEGLLPKFIARFSPDRAKWPVFISVMKGMEQTTGKMMGEMIAEVLGLGDTHIACLAGPNLAKEIARQMPASTTIACPSLEAAKKIAKLFETSSYFSTETTTDLHGTELMSCLKNVYALAAGYYSGQGYGDSSIATLITDAMSESARLLSAAGGKSDTIFTYAGLGDMIATCCSPLSRNHTFGKKLGEGKTFEETMQESDGVSEGVPTVSVIVKLANLLGVSMPVAQNIHDIIERKKQQGKQ